MNSKIIVLGSSGYIGSNLVTALGKENVTQVARRITEGGQGFGLDLAKEILPSDHAVFAERPARVFYLGRPTDTDYQAYRIYHTNVQRLLLAWCNCKELKDVHFASSTLVYPTNAEIATAADKLNAAPHGLYEYFKIETEVFLQFLAIAVRNDVRFTSWRLPLVVGGVFDPQRHTTQFIYWFLMQYISGHSWKFESDLDRRYGSSWLFLPDMIQMWLQLPMSAPGYSMKNVSSGFFTFYQLHQYFTSKLGAQGKQPFKLFRSRCQVADDAGVPQRRIEDVLNHVYHWNRK